MIKINDQKNKYIERITILEESKKSTDRRLDLLEENQKLLFEMNANIRLIAQQNKNQNKEIKTLQSDIDQVNKKVDRLEKKPLISLEKKVNNLKWFVISTLIGAVIGYFCRIVF